MILTPRGILEHSRTDAGRRMIRYASTSLICVVLTQILIVVFYTGFEMKAEPANLAATMLISIPAYLLNKYWVWGKRGRPHLRREVIPFWTFTVAGWVLSTGMVALVSDHVGTPHSLVRTISVMVASIAGFGLLWVMKYLFLDKIMFGPRHHTPYDEEFEIEEAVLESADVGEV
ncbi:MAG: GtrA family protein [Acidimicrobiales bacterium]|nr:GtrA family protein [Acidimicrobiales bacterium]